MAILEYSGHFAPRGIVFAVYESVLQVVLLVTRPCKHFILNVKKRKKKVQTK